MTTRDITIERFSAAAYAPFGTAVMRPDRPFDSSEEFSCAWLLPTDMDGSPQWAILRHLRQPLQLSLMERHHNVAQMFVPIAPQPYIMVCAPPTPAGSAGKSPDLDQVRAFYLDGSFGLIINRGTWHALDRLPVTDAPFDVFFVTEKETQEDMIANAATPEALVRSDIVDLGVTLVLRDRDGVFGSPRS